MCKVESNGKLIDSGDNNLYIFFFLSILIKSQVFTVLRQDTAMFSKLLKIEYIITIGTQCLKPIQLYSKPHFQMFTRKKGPLSMLLESPILVS